MKLSILTATYNRGNLLKNIYESINRSLINIYENSIRRQLNSKDLNKEKDENKNVDNFYIEWIIIDDGSTDNTKKIVEGIKRKLQLIKNERYQKEESYKQNDSNINFKSKIEIKYIYQENSGKMAAINNGMRYVTGNLCVDCDSDDFFTNDAFRIIYNNVNNLELLSKEKEKIYGICFLKKDLKGNISGEKFKKEFIKTTMFELYFKEDVQGEKVIVFNTEVRKKFKHELERR